MKQRFCGDCGEDISDMSGNCVRCLECREKRKREVDHYNRPVIEKKSGKVVCPARNVCILLCPHKLKHSKKWCKNSCCTCDPVEGPWTCDACLGSGIKPIHRDISRAITCPSCNGTGMKHEEKKIEVKSKVGDDEL